MARVLIISDFFKPGYRAGGPIQSMYNLCKLISRDIQTFVLSKNTDFNSSIEYDLPKNKWLELDNYQIKYCTSESYNLKQIESAIHEIKPNYIYFNSLFSTLTIKFIVKHFFHKTSPTIIIAPRGQLDSGALSLKSSKKYIFLKVIKYILDENIIFHATTELEKENINKYFKQKCIVAHNVPKLIEQKPTKPSKEENKTNLVFISRISPKKNLAYAIKLLENLKIEGEINFDIIGPIEDEPYWQKVKDLSKALPQNIKMNYIGEVNNDELMLKTINYHYLLFPTLAENYGHIIYECLSYGIPVIISERTPWLENKNGVYVRNLDNDDDFKELIEYLHTYNETEYNTISNQAFNFATKFINFEKLLLDYKNLFNENTK